MQTPLQDRVLTLCGRDYKVAEVLSLAVSVEEKNDHSINILGWSWSDVRAPNHLLRKLVIEGGIKVSYSSRSSTCYKLVDRETTKHALSKSKEGQVTPTSIDLEILHDIFSPIVGYEDIKNWLIKSLKTEKPVHILLIGPPASSKSLILMEIARIPGAAYYSGTGATRAGVQRFLADVKPLILVIDDIDKMGERDQAALYTVMQTGVVTELKVGRVRREYVPVRVYAAGNTDATLGDALRSRF